MTANHQPKSCSRTLKSRYLVDEEHGVPACREFERLTEACIEVACACSQISTPDNVQGTTEVFACRLCGERFSDTRWPEEVDDEALSLSLYKIVEPGVTFMRGSEGSMLNDDSIEVGTNVARPRPVVESVA